MALLFHDGQTIPTADPKDPDSDVWYGFSYTLEDSETISSSTWLINDTAVTDGDTVDGLTFVTSQESSGVTKARLSGGTAGQQYKLTNRVQTNVTPSDDRSMYIKVFHL